MSEHSILAGFSRIEITPPLQELDVWGLGYWYQRKIRFTGVRDPLYVRTLALGDDATCQLIISVDAIFDTFGFIEKAVAKIAMHLAVSEERVFITCTHSHSTPLIVRNNTLQGAEYGPYVAERIVASACEAFRRRETMFASLCRGNVTGVLRNRRPLLKNGQIAELHADLDSSTIADLGPVNDVLTMLAFRRPSGHLKGALCHFGIHGVSIQCSDLISSDCMGRAIQRFESEVSPDAVILHLNGPCGDIDPVAMGDAQALESMTEQLLAGIQDVVATEELPISMTPQKSSHINFFADRRLTRSDEILAEAAQRIASDEKAHSLSHHSGPGYERFLLEEEKKVSEMPQKIRISCQILRSGNLILVGVGGEIFTCFGVRLAALTDRLVILPVGITGKSSGYLPPQYAFSQGGYEVTCAQWCPIAPGETEKLFAQLEQDLRATIEAESR